MSYTNRIESLLKELNAGIYEKEQAIRLVLLAFISGKSCFLYGPPGTAKSLIARRVALAFSTQTNALDSHTAESAKAESTATESNPLDSHSAQAHSFFAYLMNRFSTPEEIFGPIDIAELKQNRLTRSTQGYLPTAHFAFLDEIWKSSPAILNTLLTIINEKIYRDGNADIKVPLKGLVCASNEFPPPNQGLEALYDRLVLRLCVLPVEGKKSFESLLQTQSKEVKISNPITPSELDSIQSQARQVGFSKAALQAIHTLRGLIEAHNKEKQTHAQSSQDSTEQNTQTDHPQDETPTILNGIYISDRRWRAMAELLQSAALLSDRAEVLPIDITLLGHCLWSDEVQRETIQSLIAKALRHSAQSDEGINDIANIEGEYSKLYDTAISECYVKDRAGEYQPKNMNETTKTLYVEKCDSLLSSISAIQARLEKKYYTTQETIYNPFVSESDYSLVLQGIIESSEKAKQLHIAIDPSSSTLSFISLSLYRRNMNPKPAKT